MTDTEDPCDILVHIALDEEYDALLQRLPIAFEQSEPFERYTIRRGRLRADDGTLRTIVFLVSGEVGDRARELGTLAARRYTPEYLVNVGISGMVNGDAKVGDIVLPVEFFNYVHRSKVRPADYDDTDFEIIFGGRLVDADLGVVNQLKKFYSDGRLSLPTMDEYCSSRETLTIAQRRDIELICTTNGLFQRPKLMSGPVVVGPFVAKSGAFIQQHIRKKSPDALAIDMESGILADALRVLEEPAPQFLSIRGISDPGDSSKEFFDKAGDGAFRRWAITNISTVLIMAIRILPSKRAHHRRPDIIDSPTYPHTLADRYYDSRYVGQSFSEFSLSERNKARFSNLSKVNQSEKNSKSTISEFIITLTRAAPGANFILRGQRGCGKSPLLYFAFQNINSVPKGRIAFYIDIEAIVKVTRIEDFREVTDSLQRDISAFLQRHSEIRPIFFFDGCVGDDREHGLVDAIRSVSGGVAVAVFAEGGYVRRDSHGRLVEASTSYLGRLAYSGEFALRAISIRAEDDVKTLIQGILGSIPSGKVVSSAEEICKKIKVLQFDYITHYVISIVLENYQKPAFRNLVNSTLFIEMAMKSLVPNGNRPKDVVYNDICIEALCAHSNALYSSRSDGHDELDARRVYDEIFARQPRIVQTMMIARAVIELFTSVSSNEGRLLETHGIDRVQFLRIVFDNDVNASVKHFMSDLKVQQKLLETAKLLAQHQVDINSLSFSLYLLGRITSPRYKAEALSALRTVREVLENGIPISRRIGTLDSVTKKYARLSLRSLYISLANQEEQAATDYYIDKLTADPLEDELNRGFHLEYYGDRRSEDIGVDLQFSDDLQRWNRTSSYLLGHLTKCIGKSIKPIDQIRLVTYLSFIRARHENKMLKETDRLSALDLIERLSVGLERLAGSATPRYVEMVKRNLQHKAFDSLDFIMSIYALKGTVRAGWRVRHIATQEKYIETVAAHSFGCALLAEILLDPEDPAWTGLNIEKVKALTLLHDVGEFDIGDYLPQDKPTVDERREIDYISVMGCYAGLRDLSYVRDLFNEYERQSSREAQIARELDKIDALIQGYIYTNEFPNEADFQRFMRDHYAQIRTLRLRSLVWRLVYPD